MSWDEWPRQFYVEEDLFDRMARIMRKDDMGLHSEAQLVAKRMSVRVAAEQFAEKLRTGALEDEAMLHHEIESLYQILEELKRG